MSQKTLSLSSIELSRRLFQKKRTNNSKCFQTRGAFPLTIGNARNVRFQESKQQKRRLDIIRNFLRTDGSGKCACPDFECIELHTSREKCVRKKTWKEIDRSIGIAIFRTAELDPAKMLNHSGIQSKVEARLKKGRFAIPELIFFCALLCNQGIKAISAKVGKYLLTRLPDRRSRGAIFSKTRARSISYFMTITIGKGERLKMRISNECSFSFAVARDS